MCRGTSSLKHESLHCADGGDLCAIKKKKQQKMYLSKKQHPTSNFIFFYTTGDVLLNYHRSVTRQWFWTAVIFNYMWAIAYSDLPAASIDAIRIGYINTLRTHQSARSNKGLYLAVHSTDERLISNCTQSRNSYATPFAVRMSHIPSIQTAGYICSSGSVKTGHMCCSESVKMLPAGPS